MNPRSTALFLCVTPDEKQRTPEETLWSTVLTLAVHDFVGSHKLLRDMAEEWLLSDSVSPRSFRWVCVQLDVDPGAVRRKVFALAPGSIRKHARSSYQISPDNHLTPLSH